MLKAYIAPRNNPPSKATLYDRAPVPLGVDEHGWMDGHYLYFYAFKYFF
jgi:hypothetical protein